MTPPQRRTTGQSDQPSGNEQSAESHTCTRDPQQPCEPCTAAYLRVKRAVTDIAVPCPLCGARPGKCCTASTGTGQSVRVHAERKAAADAD